MGHLHALLFAKLGQADEAMAALREVVKLEPHRHWSTEKLAELLLASGATKESQALYENLVVHYPNWAPGHYGFGQLLLRAGEVRPAIEHLEQAVAIEERFGAAHYALSMAYRQHGNSQKAKTHYQIVESVPRFPQSVVDPLRMEIINLDLGQNASIKRANEFTKQGRPREAARELEKAAKSRPDNVTTRADLVALYGHMGDIDRAENHYREAIALNPSHFGLHMNIGALRMRQKRFNEAANAFRRATEIDPTIAPAFTNLGAALERAGQNEEAEESYRMALAKDATLRQPRYFLAKLLTKKGDFVAAINHLHQVLEPVDEKTPWYQRALATIYAASGNTALAKKTFDEANDGAEKFGDEKLATLIAKDLEKLTAAAKSNVPAAE